nr:translocation/assembly module TamB domain-containing protein [Motiliproteus sp. SC1-56]
MKADAEAINPGLNWPEWPGEVSLRLRSRGELDPARGVKLDWHLDSLSGTLRGETLAGRGNGALDGRSLQVDDAALQLGGARITLDGRVDETLDVNWSAAIPNLQRLLDARGRIEAQGRLSGPLEAPRVLADISARELAWQQSRLDALNADVRLDPSGEEPSWVKVEASGLEAQGQSWGGLTLSGEGTPLQHRVSLNAAGGPVSLIATLAGSWENAVWQGALSGLRIENPWLDRWQQQAPVALRAAAAGVELDSLCLQGPRGAQLCASGSRTPTDIELGLNFSQLPLSLAGPWLPPGTEVDGGVQGRAALRRTGAAAPAVELVTELVGARLWLPDSDLRFTGDTARLEVQGDGDALQGTLRWPLSYPRGRIEGDFKLEDPYGEARLQGGLGAEISDLRFLALLVPAVQSVKGVLKSTLVAGGTLDNPRWQGAFSLEQGGAEVPALGIALAAVGLNIESSPAGSGLQLRGGLRSGEGEVHIEGEFDPLQGTARVSLDGDRFQAVGTEEVKAWISPEIEFSMTPEVMKLRGEVRVPEAEIKPPKIESATAPSSDVVVREAAAADQREDGQARALDARLRLTLGDEVQLDALGFNGRLEGSVLIEDDQRRATRATGTLRVAAGEYRLYGQDLTIERGSLVFSGGPLDNPGLDLRISREVEEVTVGARVSGTLRDPRLDLFSTPSMPEQHLLSYLLLGRAPGAQATTSEQEMLQKAAMALAVFGGNSLAENVQDQLKVDELGLESGEGIDQTALYIGKYLSPRLYVKYGVGLLEPTNTFFMRYRLGRGWSLESQTGTYSSGGDLIYIFER